MEEQNKEVKQEVAINNDDYLKKMNELLNLTEIAELINNNEKIFEIKGVTYRIKKPNYNQKQEVYKKRIEKYVEMLKDEKYLLEKDLKELYKKRNIDIDEMDKIIVSKVKRRDEFMLKLGQELKNGSPDTSLKTLKEEIENLNSELQKVSVEKNSLLEFSLEQQLSIFIYSYFVFTLAEKKEGETWIRVWNDYNEFMNAEQELINRCVYYVTLMLGQDLL